ASGHFCGWVPRYLRVPNARASCLSHSFQSVGLGLPSVIGLAVANPGKLAVLGTGDGGFLMSMADLETALRLKLRLCILVYNDSSYAAEVHYFRRQGYSVDIVQFPPNDFAAMARGFGACGITARTLADLAPLRAWVADVAPGVFQCPSCRTRWIGFLLRRRNPVRPALKGKVLPARAQNGS